MPQDGGHLFIAHRAEKVAFLRAEARVMNEQFGYAVRMLERDELHARLVRRARGGRRAVRSRRRRHPSAQVHLRAGGAGARARRAVHTASPVQRWSVRGGVHHLRTPGGTVRARRVAVCTGGYTGQRLNPLLKNRLMPILSNSVVTRVLTEAERAACNLRSQTFMTDTRTLRFYYRLLKDNRLQIGSRSAVTGADAADPSHEKLLTDAIARKFPPLAGIAIDHSWWGWVDVSHDMMPRIARPDPQQNLWYALGYGGNGVSFSTQAGKRLAERIVGQDVDQAVFDLPIYRSALPFPNVLAAVEAEAFAPFRRIGQRMLYRWYWLRDEKL